MPATEVDRERWQRMTEMEMLHLHLLLVHRPKTDDLTIELKLNCPRCADIARKLGFTDDAAKAKTTQ